MINQDLEQLKKIVFTDQWEQDAKDAVKNLESHLLEVAAAEKSAEHPAVKPFLDYLSERIKVAETHLQTKRTSAIEQEYLFAVIEIAKRFTDLFNGVSRTTVEKNIKDNLDVAKTR